MNLSHLVLALFIIFHKTLFAFVLFSGRHCVVIRSGISRNFPDFSGSDAKSRTGQFRCGLQGLFFRPGTFFQAQSFLSKRRLPSKPDLGMGFAVCSNLGAL